MGSVIGGLLLLALSAFSSATILPGSSEVALGAYIHLHPELTILAFVVATVFNTMGSMAMLWVGRVIPNRKKPSPKVDAFIQRFGVLSLLFAGVPVVGDLLPIAAGWLRLNVFHSLIAILTGKTIRYLFVLGFLKVIERWLA